MQDQLGRDQTEVEIHVTAMTRPEDAPLSDVYQLTLSPFVREAPVLIRSWTARIYMNLPALLDTGATPP